MSAYSLDYEATGTFGEILEKVKASLKDRGFGTLSEINVQATLDEKIGKKIAPYTILGVCNPDLAGQAIDFEPKIGVFLPCTVVVRQAGDQVRIHAQDPELISTIMADNRLEELSQDVRTRIATALAEIGTRS